MLSKRKLHQFQRKLQALINILKDTLRDWWWKVHLHIYVSFPTELWNVYNKALAQISKKTNKSKMWGNNASVTGWSARVCNPANSLTVCFRSLRTQGIENTSLLSTYVRFNLCCASSWLTHEQAKMDFPLFSAWLSRDPVKLRVLQRTYKQEAVVNRNCDNLTLHRKHEMCMYVYR